MASENPKNPPADAWTTVTVRVGTADAVCDMQAAYRRKHGKNISQDLVVRTALGMLKVSDLQAPPKRVRGAASTTTGKH